MYHLWPFGRFRHYRLTPDALEAARVLAIREAILDSAFMSINNLNMRFAGTYGFSVVFRREQLSEVERQFPAFASYLARAVRPGCNAFFLNPLLVADGAQVMPHIDLSLQTYCPATRTPRFVTVLYVAVPEKMRGGELRLYEGDRPVATITPRKGSMLTFRGDLRHEVTEVLSGAPDIYEARLSLVIEQYRLTEDQLRLLPPYQIGTRRMLGAAAPPLAGGPGEGQFGDEIRHWLGESTP